MDLVQTRSYFILPCRQCFSPVCCQGIYFRNQSHRARIMKKGNISLLSNTGRMLTGIKKTNSDPSFKRSALHFTLSMTILSTSKLRLAIKLYCTWSKSLVRSTWIMPCRAKWEHCKSKANFHTVFCHVQLRPLFPMWWLEGTESVFFTSQASK